MPLMTRDSITMVSRRRTFGTVRGDWNASRLTSRMRAHRGELRGGFASRNSINMFVYLWVLRASATIEPLEPSEQHDLINT